MKEKFDIIILAGQSNAEGNGWKEENDPEIINENVFHLIDKNPASIYGKTQVEPYIEVAHERHYLEMKAKAADISETFADEYIKGGYLKAGRSILVVKAAVSGSSFAVKEWGWGIGNPLIGRLFRMTDYALSLNKENRIVALLWHQGETDAMENVDFTEKERYDFYYENFFEQMKAIRTRYNEWNFPIIAGEFVPSWAWGVQNKEKVDAIYKATRNALENIGNFGIVSSAELKSNGETVGKLDNFKFCKDDDIHFCADSVYEFGRRYYKVFENIKKQEENNK